MTEKKNLRETGKKVIVFSVLGILFVACLYLIFAPSKNKKEEGINTTVPPGEEEVMAANKIKGYEMSSLSDNSLSDDSLATATSLPQTQAAEVSNDYNSYPEPSEEYQESLEALTRQYEDLVEEFDAYKDKMAENQEIRDTENETLSDALAKVYAEAKEKPIIPPEQQATKLPTVMVSTNKRQIVSRLESNDESNESSKIEYNSFHGTPVANIEEANRNTIKAVVDKTTLLKNGDYLSLRLVDPITIGNKYIPKNSYLSAKATVSGNRMRLHVTSISANDAIVAVNLSAFDLDGQEGIYLHQSLESEAVNEAASRAVGSLGRTGNYTISTSPVTQISTDAARMALEGASAYAQKKLSRIRIKVKSGHKLYLVEKQS